MRFKTEMISVCLEKIEEKFDHGPAETWTTRDFSDLALEIQEKTNTQLSVSTLKRLWGRINHKNQPNQTTLDTLAQFLGSTHWRHFTKTVAIDAIDEKGKEKKNFGWPRNYSPILLLSLVGVLILLFLITFLQSNIPHIDDSKIVFKGEVVTQGVPNSVVFTYKLNGVEEDSKIEIQQSWDERKQQQIQKNDSVATSIYYRPGLFEAKLLVNDATLKETEVFIKTQGWMGLVEREPFPIYLLKKDFLKEGVLRIGEANLKAYDVRQDNDLWTGFYLAQEFKNLTTDDFTFSAELINTTKPRFNTCKRVRIAILHKGGGTVIPLTKKGCISEVYVKIFDELISGKNTDLSNFGIDFSSSVNLKCISDKGFFTIFIDGNEVLRQKVPEIKKEIVGIVVNFEGTGIIKRLNFKNSQGEVYDLASEKEL